MRPEGRDSSCVRASRACHRARRMQYDTANGCVLAHLIRSYRSEASADQPTKRNEASIVWKAPELSLAKSAGALTSTRT
jgi:hypothetical protein